MNRKVFDSSIDSSSLVIDQALIPDCVAVTVCSLHMSASFCGTKQDLQEVAYALLAASQGDVPPALALHRAGDPQTWQEVRTLELKSHHDYHNSPRPNPDGTYSDTGIPAGKAPAEWGVR